MVETRRSSSASSKRPSSPPANPLPPRGNKRSKASLPAAEVEVSGDRTPDPKEPGKPPADPCPAADPAQEPASAAPAEERAPDELSTQGCTPAEAEQLVKLLEPLGFPKKKVAKVKPKAPWGRFISQCSQNPHLPMFGSQFTVGQSESCNLCLRDPTVSTVLCKLKHNERCGESIVVLEISGSKGSVQVNGKTIGKKSSIVLTGGDEVVFNSSGKHSYIFQLLSNEKPSAPVLAPSRSSSDALGVSIRGIQFEPRPGDPSAVAGAKILANLKKSPSAFPPLPPNDSSSEVDLSGNVCKMLEDGDELPTEFEPSVPSEKHQAFKDALKQGYLSANNIEVSFDKFPYYLSENTKNALMLCSYIHLERKEYVKYTTNISSLNQRILLSGPAGSEIYQETLAKALAKHFGAGLLIIESLLLPGGSSSRGVGTQKEGTKTEKLGQKIINRAALADALQPRKPASSVEADIVGTSALYPQMLKQEASTASSRTYSFKEGERVKYVGQHNEEGFQSPRGPSYGFCGKVILAFEENVSSKVGIRFDKKIPEGNDLGGRCEKDHGFFCPVDLLRLEHGGCDDERLAINELLEVMSEESKFGPLIIFVKEIEKAITGSTDSYTILKSKLETVPSGVIVIGSHIQADSRKEKAHPGSLFFDKISHICILRFFSTGKLK